MIVKVKYFNEEVGGYGGQEYTYRTYLPVVPFTKVIAPTYKGDNKAIVTEINLPESVQDEFEAKGIKLKEIERYDT